MNNNDQLGSESFINYVSGDLGQFAKWVGNSTTLKMMESSQDFASLSFII